IGDEEPNRLDLLREVLSQAIDFDDIFLYARQATPAYHPLENGTWLFADLPVDLRLKELERPQFEMEFRKGDREVDTSAGQMVFALKVIALLATLSTESLLIIDEPESFLHPNLEIAFVRMLKTLLTAFHSYAIIATHSPIIVREVPSECVQVLRILQGRIPIAANPPFQVFGSDITKITNFVFDNPIIDLPYQQTLLAEYGDQPYSELLERSTELNMESIAFLRNARSAHNE
ncbi:MAG TPA: AAA family ATPase, partial [Candidatus Baltobacteraceae bacterium]|nr:AAA family ATPase [Candidatus Baltobacteraceae bacterium]